MASCSMFHSKPESPPIDFDPNYINQQIRLGVVKELSEFRTNSPIALLLLYNTTNEITLPANYNLRIFIQQETQWVEIKEEPTIRPMEPIILSPSIPSSYGQIITFLPQLDDLTKTYYMRVYVIGDMKTPEGIKKVAAFADFTLTP